MSVAIPEILSEVTALHAAGRFAAAEARLRAALQTEPESFALHNACGVMLASQGRYHEAVACYREALRRTAVEPGVWTNLGNALTHLKLYDSAIACHDAALARSGADGGLHYNRGISLAESGRHGEAVAAFTQALRHDPRHSMAAWDRGRSYLHLGNFAAGWRDYAVRLENKLVPARAVPGVPWSGAPYAGERLILLAEQGFGDMIWASRFLPRVKALGGELVVECQAELAGLYRAMAVADRVVVKGEALPEADLHAWHCSLPGLFAPDIAAIPDAVPLRPGPARMAALRPLLDQAGGRLRVGIVWSGSVTFARNADRAQALKRFIDAFDQPGVQLFSLQKGPPEAELAAAAHRVIDLAPALHGFDDTAAAVAMLDLVIMTDSAVAHLAGTMGRPVWLLLGRNAHWLWLQDRTDSPWYPSLRLFRPRGEGDWDHVFDQAGAALMRLTATRSASA